MATVEITDEVYTRVERRIADSEFDSVDSYATYVLTEVLDQIEGPEAGEAGDRDEVLDKLRDLGYLE